MNGCTRLLREMAAYALDNPDKTAVCDGSGSVTYSEFWSRIGRLSNLLRLRGVSAGDAVVIDLDRNSEHLASRYAALAVGAVPVSLSPAYPEARKKAVAERTGAKAVIDDGFVKESEGLPDTAEIDDVDDSAPGYIAFTSGSTGEPKGVVHERSVFPYLMDCYRSADVDITGMRLGALSDFSFIASMVETHIFLAAGAEVHIIDRGAAKDPASLLRYFKSNSIDSALFNPSMYKALSDKLDLRICLLAGEAARRIPVPEGRMVLNIYGSTEALMSFTLVDKDVPDVRVDRTAPGCRLYLDGSGEILFTGRGIMIGYLGGLENPFSVDADGRKVFRTGDLGREVEGGIAVVGRMDGMVKVRGYRVEPAEIERNMENIPGIEEAAVKAFEDGGGAYLCGYFRSGTVTEEEVAKELSRTLPSYMVPQFISKVGSFIHNANGKIDRTSLTTLKTGKGNYVPPENERQREICEAFSKVLDIERVGIDDDFIDLGGDSIRAMRLQSETGIGVGDVMRLRTPRRIAESAAEQSPDAIPDWKGGCAPNESQMNVYLDMEANGRSNEYNVFFEVPLDPGTSDADAWRAVDSVIAAHPVLRARMASRDGRPWILFDAEPERCGPEDEGFEDRPFILSEGMCRFSVRKNKVLVCACHIVMDGYSAKVVERDMRNSLEGMALSEDAGFMLSSVRDSRMKDSGAYAEARAFFDSMLDDADAGLLHDHDGSLGITDHELSTDAEKVSELARCMGTTAGAVHTAAFAYALSRFTGRSDATFCIADNGRDSRGLEDSVGMFVRTVPVRMDCSDRGVRGFIAESSDVLLKSVSYGYYPFRRLASEHGVGREVMFQYRSDMGVDGGRSSGSRRGTVSDFSFIVGDSGKGLVVRIERSSAFSEGTARRLAETYDRILTGLCECGRLSEIGYLPDEDSSLSKGIEGPRAELRRGNLVEAFREAVSLFPERTAVSFRGRRVTYSEADGITDGIASELSRRGIGSGDFVGVLVPRSEWYFLCAIGVLKTGAAYVPMDDAYPDERLSLMARDTSSKAVLALPETMGRANRLSDGRALDCSSIRKEGFRPVDINPLSPAVVLYTSGTTGKPKGSVITHRAIDNMCEWYVGYTCMSEEDVYSLYTSYSFDIHTIGLFSPLYSGASVDIVPEEVRLDMPALNGHFIDADTTHTFMTTQVGKLFASMDMPSKIKALMYGGEKLGEFHAPEHLGAIETYGPSENLALSTAIMVNDRNYPDSVGRLLPNMKAYVLDAERRPVPRGAVGELYLSGYQLSLGYLNRDESNARAFFDNPFSDEPGFERMYATGDFFRVLPDGILGVVGRRDGQVKIRGNRVELTEIETAIRDMPGIRDVTVQAVPSGPGKELCAYVVGEAGAEAVKAWVAERKPSYMVPAFVVGLESVPRNVNGKVDRRALPAPDASSLRAEYVPPRDEAERRLCEAFEDVLEVGRIGIDDDFIRLGGDSLKAIRIQNLTPGTRTADILRYRTPRLISRRTAAQGAGHMFDEQTGCPLTESQMNVYLDLEAKGKKGAYLIPFKFQVPPGKTAEDARAALESVIAAQPALRGRIAMVDDGPRMLFDSHPAISDDLPDSIDVDSCMSAFSVSDREIRGLISHLAFDGMSSAILSDDLADALNGMPQQRNEGVLRAAEAEAAYRKTGYGSAEAFFDTILGGADCETGLLPDRDGTFGTVEKAIPLPIGRISSKAGSMGSTTGAFLASAFGYALSRFTGRSDAVFCVLDNGRDSPDVDRTVGMFVRTVPVRMDCSDRGILEFISESSKTVYEATSHGRYPFRKLSEAYGVGSDTLFQYIPGDEAASLERDLTGADPRATGLISDLTVMVGDMPDGPRVYVSHSDRYSDATAERLADAFARIVEGMTSCDRLSEIGLISESDLEIVRKMNDTSKPLECDGLVQAFRVSVSRFPERAAVSYDGRSVTYAEADGITDGIASELSRLGIGSGDFVAVLVPRSEWYFLCAIGVLKTGAAYVPMDDAYPDERLSFMARDSGAAVTLVTPETAIRAESMGLDAIDCISCERKKFQPVATAPSSPAVILYTSGTTGKPKGSVITHKAIDNMCEWYVGYTGMSEEDVYSLYTSYSFDIHTMGIFAPLYRGASVDIVPERVRLDMAELNRHFVDAGATHTFMTTQIGKLFASMDMPSRIKALMYGGEKLGEFHAPEHLGAIETYGPSENLALSTAVMVNDRNYPDSVGRLLPNIKAYVLDAEKRMVPCGAVGELHLSGYQLSLGYLNRDDLNSKAFLENPFSDEPGFERMYATGDFFRVLPDGTLGVIGRRDGQVKIRGNRVELTEIETAIRDMPGIRDVTVQAVPSGPGKELCAYVVGEAGAEAVKAWVAERKPSYMVPAFVVGLESIPRNVNGKVDRRALPEPDVSSLKAEYAAPRNEGERKVCEAMAKILGEEKVGIDDDFIRLGGDSLKAVRLAAACRSMGITVPAQEVIARRTVRSLSPLISAAVDAGPYSGPIGLSPIQERFMSSGTASQRDRHNQSVILRSSERIDLKALQKAVDAVTDHHDMLRALYSYPYSVRAPGVRVCEVEANPAADRERMSEAMDAAQGSLSLEEGRNMACLLFSLETDYVFIAIHHMAVDGASWSVILDDLSSAYRSIKSGNIPRLPPRTSSYASWLDACSEPLRREESEYWKAAEGAVPEAVRIASQQDFTLVSDFPLPSAEDGPFGFDSADILAAALAEAYSELAEEDGVTVRMEGHGRVIGDVERTVGWFTDMYPLRLAATGDPLKDLFESRRRLHEVPRGGIGYESERRGRPLPQITLNYLSNAFSFSDGLFETVFDIPMGRASDVLPDDRISLNVSDVGGVFAITGYHDGTDVMSRLPEAFMKAIRRVSKAATEPDVYMRPLSEGQLNVYLDEMAESKGTGYNAPGMVSVKGIPADKVRKAVEAMIEAHPVLKSRITEYDGTPWMVANSYPEISEGPLDGFARPFDLGGCLSRFRISDEFLVWDVHHAIMDASSRNVLIRDLRDALSGKDVAFETRAFDVSEWHAPESIWKAEEFFDGMLDGADADPGLVPDLDGKYGMSRKRISCGRKEIERTALSNGAAVGSLFASAFAYTLSRFTGRSDAVFVITDTGRASADMSDAVGMFVRTVPLRIDCSDAAVGEYIRKTSSAHLGAMANDFIPFRELSRRHGVGISVLFEYNAGINADFESEASLAGEALDAPPEYGIVSDIQCVVTDSEDGFDVSVYHSDSFSVGTADRMVQVFDSVVSGLASCERLSEIEIASEEDRMLSERINETSRELRFGDVLEAFRDAVAKVPDNAFVSVSGRSLSYAECDRMSDSVAGTMISAGVRPGDSVAVLVPRGEWYVLCALGALKAGASYVPMDDAYPDERLSYIVKDSSAKALLCTPETLRRGRSLSPVPVLDCTAESDTPTSLPGTNPEDPMVVLYTSGTTGKPKGSVLSRRAIENLSEWYCEYTDLKSNDVVGMHTSYSFDMHAVAIYPPILAGASVYIVPEEARRDLDALESRISEAGVTHMFITTQLGKMFAPRAAGRLKVLILAGEKLGPFDAPEGVRTIDAYGPSENHVSTAIDVSQRCCAYSVGRLLPNVKGYVLDAEKRMVPYGAIGELHLSGYQLSLGYLNRDDLNSKAFLRNPFSSEPGFERMYATGDFVKILPDGTIGILGRRDGQVKIRGNRVELTEVEAAIREMPGVRDVTVQSVPGASGKELCAYVVGDADEDAIKAWVAERKPDYMVPSFVMHLDEIPLNVNGKVDWRALPAPDASSLRSEYVPPRNADESSVCHAFEKALGIDRVGIDDDFIRLGGDSLKAIKVQSLSGRASASDILRYRTPRAIASHSIGGRPQEYSEETGCPLSESQLNVYLDMVANPEAGDYVIPFSFKIPDGRTESDARVALERAISAHPSLRGRISEKDGTPWMLFDASPEISSERPRMPAIDECVSSFAISDGMIRGLISHVAFDGYSSSVLSEDLAEAFDGKEPAKDPGVLVSSSFDRSVAESPRYEDAEKFFESMLCDADVDAGLIEDVDGSSGSSTIVLSCSSEEMASKAAACGSSPGALATAAFAYALSRFTGRSDAVFCIAENGRDVPGLERSIGMFVRTVPLRIDCSDSTVDEFISKASETVYGAMSSGFVPFRKLSSEYGVKPDVIFQYAPRGEASETMQDILSESPDKFSSSGTSVAVMDLPDGMRAVISHGLSMSAETAEGILDALDRTLAGIVRDERMSEIVYVDPEDAGRSIADGGRADYRYGSIVHAMRAHICDDVMLTHLDKSYTYRMADLITDGIAARLHKSGIGKGDAVAFLVPRSEWYVLCALGIMKSGAAFVPMDDAYPDERLSFMAEDAGIKAILATAETLCRAWSVAGVETIDCTTCEYVGDDDSNPDPDSTAVILYTSGTTGKPKGAALTHAALANICESVVKCFELTSKDKMGLHASIGFDAGLTVYSALFVGGSMDVLPEDVRLDMGRMNDYLASNHVTGMSVTAQVGRIYAAGVKEHALRNIMVGGEMTGFIEPPPGLRIIDAYGPTECAVFVTQTDVTKKSTPRSVGRPNANLRAYVLDAEKRIMPRGAAGELHVSGIQVSPGYLNRADLDSKAFIGNPFTNDPRHSRMYCTGDFARILPDGSVEMLGRRDGQVKIRGNRVELTEIETAIRDMPGVDGAVVQAVARGSGKELCAYVVGDVDEDEVRRHVGDVKPSYMVPTYVVKVDSIPLNINGKVDWRALPKPDLSEGRAEYVAPRNHAESALCKAFENALGIEEIGIDDDFIRLGGDSLKAIRVQNESQVSTTVDVLRYRTPRAIAEHSASMDFDRGMFSYEEGCPLNESQMNVYLDIEANSKSEAYLVPFEFEIPAGRSEDEAEEALRKVIDAHPILRSRIVEKDGEPWLAFDSEPNITKGALEKPDLRRCLSSFSLSEGSVKGEISHMAFDGMSYAVLAESLSKAFAGETLEKDVGTLVSSAFDRSVKDNGRFAEAERLFDSMLCDGDADSGLVGDHGAPGKVDRRISADISSIKDAAKGFGTSVGNLMTSAFAYALSRFTGRSDAVFCVLDNGRSIPGLEKSVGMFVRTVPVRIDCSDRDADAYVAKASETVYRCVESGFMPFRELSSKYGVKADVLFQNMPVTELRDSPDAEEESIADLVAVTVELPDSARLVISHSSRFTDEYVSRFVETFDSVLSGMIAGERLSKIKFAGCIPKRGEAKALNHYSAIDAFRESVGKFPDRAAVTFEGRTTSYAEADAITDGIASKLSEIGVRAGDRVAVLVPRSEWYYLCAVGVLKTGASYVPMDDAYPDERLSFMARDAGIKAVLVTSGTIGRARSVAKTEAVDCARCGNKTFQPISIEPLSPAVILYTSGTTGKPKGSMITHRAIVNLSEWYVGRTEMREEDVYALYTSYSFDMHAIGMFPPMFCGASVDVVPEDVRLDMRKFNDHLVEAKATHTFMTTQVGKMFASMDLASGLKVLLVAGEKLGEFHAPEHLDAMDGYGPSENLAISTAVPINARIDPDSVGFPLQNVAAYVLDAERRPVPRGAVGELFLSGYQLSLGYLNREDANARAFFANPFSSEPGFERMYATGDFARILHDGTIGILGRRDGQVKIRGNRVELTEVEAAVRGMPGVRDVTVQAVPGASGKELCAYAVGDVDEEAVKAWVAERKPSYMVPAFVIGLESIPRNVNGKVDRRALPAPDSSSLRAEYIPPRNEIERRLCEAMEAVLDVESIGIDDDFIRLGGDSLKAIRVQNESQVSTTVDVLRYRTPRAIAEHSASVDFDRGMFSYEEGCPLNESQMNVYLDIEANGKYDAYLIPFAYDMPSGTTEEDAKEALGKVLEAYPALSSRITDKNGEPWLMFNARPEIRSDRPEAPSLSRCLSSFSVSDGKIEGLISHIVFDGMSYAVLTESLSKAFAGETLEKDDGLLVSSAFDKSVKDTGRFAEAERLFDSMLCDGDADSGLVGDSGRSGEMAKDLSSPTEDIKTMAKSCGTSVGTLMTSAFAYTLSRFTGRSDAVFCVLDNGRSIPGLERSIGMFVKTVPVRIDCSDRAVKEYVSMASKTVYGSIASGFVPFRELSSKYGVKADVLFQHIPVAKYSAVESSDPYEAGGIADMIAITAEHQDRMRLIISHSSRFSDEFIARFAKTFDDVLAEMLTTEKLSDIKFHGDIPTRGESRALNHYSAMDAFRESADKYPDRAAVTYEGRTTSYAEVDAVTDGIASKLSEIGVGAGDRVAVLVPRGEWYYLCAVGVLKTGASYVPMDDAYPDERLSFMAEDSGAVVTLVTPDTAGRAAAMGLEALDCTSCERRKFQPVGIDPLSPAVILYTSGTTGKPKGSVITHRAIVNLSEWYVRYTGMSKDDVYALYTSYSFDMHTLGMFPPMFCGASVDIVPERVRLDMAELNRHFVDAGATHTFMTTQVGRLFASMDMPSGIKALMYGGEKLGEFHAPEHLGAIETYGPSENLALSMAIPVNTRATPDSVGFPLQNVAAYVLDAEKRLVPYGAIGELHLSGYQLSLGYLNRDDLNSKVFLRNPFSDEPGFERMYATGDFFRVLPDGTLGVVGRRDGQVKIRGNRVELTEVEATIKDMPGIRDATVQAVPSGSGKELCAYVVGEADAEAMKTWVAERKPSYMVPAFVVGLESIPRNVNGKVDRRALPAPDSSSLRAEYVQPRNETEEKICNVFETVLNVERVGIDDDFIRLGGDSLKAIRALADIRREMPGFDITPADLMRYHTPRLIAEHTRSAAGLECLYTFEEGCPLPDAMRNLYEIIKEHPDAHYNRPFLFTSESWKCAEDAVDAVKSLVDAHPILRARIAEREDGPWLTFDGPADIKVVNADPADSKDAFVRGFDIFGGELCRFQVHEWGGSVSLLMDAHHIVFDGVSFVPMAMDFACAINGIGIPMDDGVLRSASYDVSSKGRTRYNRSKALAERAVIGCSANFLEERPCERVFGDFEGGFSTPRDRIAECVKKNDTSVTAFFATALEYAFKNISGKEKCLFFITEDGRGHMDLSGSIGMYARGFPAAVAIRERSPAKVLQKMTDHVMASMTYDEYPYWELRRYMDVESVVRLQYAHFTGMDSDVVDRVPFEVEPLIRSEYRPLTDLWMRVSDDGDGYSLQIYASERYDDAVVSEVAEEFDKAVAFLTEELSRGQEASSLTV